MNKRYRTILKKFYVTESQNKIINQLIEETGMLSFSNFARTMLFKETSLLIQFDDTHFDELLFSMRRIKNNLNQLVRIAEMSRDIRSYRLMTYGVQLVSKYEKRFISYHKRKKQKLLSRGS